MTTSPSRSTRASCWPGCAHSFGAPTITLRPRRTRRFRSAVSRLIPGRRLAAIDGRTLTLTEREFALLHTLARNRGRPLHRDQLFETVWGYDSELAGNLLAVYVRRLRRKIERDPEAPQYLHTVRGYGYKLRLGRLNAPFPVRCRFKFSPVCA